MKIISIFLDLTKDGLRFTFVEWDYFEFDTTYKITNVDDFNQTTTRRIYKTELNKPKFISNSDNGFTCHLKCFSNNIEDGKQLLLDIMKKNIFNMKNNLDSLSQFLI